MNLISNKVILSLGNELYFVQSQTYPKFENKILNKTKLSVCMDFSFCTKASKGPKL